MCLSPAPPRRRCNFRRGQCKGVGRGAGLFAAARGCLALSTALGGAVQLQGRCSGVGGDKGGGRQGGEGGSERKGCGWGGNCGRRWLGMSGSQGRGLSRGVAYLVFPVLLGCSCQSKHSLSLPGGAWRQRERGLDSGRVKAHTLSHITCTRACTRHSHRPAPIQTQLHTRGAPLATRSHRPTSAQPGRFLVWQAMQVFPRDPGLWQR